MSDTGTILHQSTLDIHPNENAGELHDRMMEEGATLVLKTVQDIIAGTLPDSRPQDEKLVSHAPKLFHETCQINTQTSTKSVHDFVRGLSPHPTAWTMLEDKKVKILSTALLENTLTISKDWATDNKNFLYLSCQNGEAIAIKELQMEGKKKMSTKHFLNGYKLSDEYLL